MKGIAIVVPLLLSALASGSALAGQSYSHSYSSSYNHSYNHSWNHSSTSFGVFIGPPVFGPWWWYPPAPYYWYPPVIYRQPVILSPPPVVVQSAPAYVAPSAPAPSSVIELGPVDRPAQPTPNQSPKPPEANAPQAQGRTAQAGQVYVYPRQGQSAQQQAQDEAECNRWASSQMGTGFDASQAAANFQRALAACLDAHGYSVR